VAAAIQLFLQTQLEVHMKRFVSLTLALAFLFLASVGCSQKSTTKSTETVKGPGGTTEIEHKDTVKKSGENPPNP
jgi:ABC-type oligopeptide transport system substrate-binding subunit